MAVPMVSFTQKSPSPKFEDRDIVSALFILFDLQAMKKQNTQEFVCIPNLLALPIVVYYLHPTARATISGTAAPGIIMIRFPNETTNRLSCQFSPAIVVNKSFVAGRSAFTYSSAFGIMHIHTEERQSQTEEFSVSHTHSPSPIIGQFFLPEHNLSIMLSLLCRMAVISRHRQKRCSSIHLRAFSREKNCFFVQASKLFHAFFPSEEVYAIRLKKLH